MFVIKLCDFVEKRQIVFCHVEDEANQEIQDKFGTESKSNNVEANKVVSNVCHFDKQMKRTKV